MATSNRREDPTTIGITLGTIDGVTSILGALDTVGAEDGDFECKTVGMIDGFGDGWSTGALVGLPDVGAIVG